MPDLIRWNVSRSIVAVGAAFLLALSAAAHPPAGGEKTLPPSAAQADLKEARRLLDVAKQKLTAQGKYACCVKPVAGSKVAGCDICARNNGSCNCATHLAQGKGVCGQCVAGWKAGKGAMPGVKPESVTLLASPQQAMAPAGADVLELNQARELLNKAKRTLVSEKRYACCVRQGGCDECAFEASCPCGIELNEGKEGQGVCGSCYDGWHAGIGAFEGIALAEVKMAPPMEHMGGMSGMGHRAMQGMTGDWSMSREGSGTSWLPDSSPMYAAMKKLGSFDAMIHGYGYGVYTDQGGKRGDDKAFIASQLMGMAWKRTGNGGIVGGRAMVSFDPIFIGENGYPLLFQTGETAHGKPLIDRQHPHDLFMEIAGTYSQRLTPKGGFASFYLAPAGEPALGPTAFPHRPSAFDNPEAPLGHHWFDSTHITFGVATLGLASNSVKLEGSVFTGREPDENRYNFDRMRFDSYSGRLTVNPTRNISAQVSQGFLKSPEAQEPDVNQQRTTATVTYSLPVAGSATNWATTAGWARDRLYEPTEPMRATDAWLLESAYLAPAYTVFGRIERVDKDELFPEDPGHPTYTINKFTLGGVKGVAHGRGAEIGIGGSLSAYAFPASLKDAYGSSPVSFNVFVRIRSARM